MSGHGQVSYNTARPSVLTSAKQATRRQRRNQQMKLTLKQRIRQWLSDDGNELDTIGQDVVETSRLDSDGMRLQIYKASGGYVVETRSYDRHKDRSFNSMHVITENQDLGDALGKIVMMEALRG
jgi:hypothetical protein